ncbi:uncharacterized protein VTP21DRAFT_5337 [Calcarisporiella thermophila]|uniref:uncharacterized protein n=1 Tax=Calcarisporiella thermophila TaxID=911321 RepID=UPI003742A168
MNLSLFTLILLLCLPPISALDYIHFEGFGSTPPNNTYVTSPQRTLRKRFLPRRHQLKIALEFAKTQAGGSEFVVKNAYRSNHIGVTHVYLRQWVNGSEVVNADMNINVDKRGTVVSYGNSFHLGTKKNQTFKMVRRDKKYAQRNKLLTPEKALVSLYNHLGLNVKLSDIKRNAVDSIERESFQVLLTAPFSVAPIPARLCLIQTSSGLKRVWEIAPKMEANWIQAYIDAENGSLKAIGDWVAGASYNVFPLGVNDPESGERELVEDPYDKIASPLGWHEINQTYYTTTLGNNVYAQENHNASGKALRKFRPDGGAKLVFDFDLNLKKDPIKSLNASITNVFYWNNLLHDLFYRYGFNEVAGNFQQYNRGLGGREGDAVIAHVQYGKNFNRYRNNAFFWTPPDGYHSYMKLYIYNYTKPRRDSALSNDIIVHEYTHGLSTRLTGGPANSNCLQYSEARGMGEGWGDFIATILQMRSNHTRAHNVAHAAYTRGNKRGNRKYLYSTNMEKNPLVYATLNKYRKEHAMGNVWATILYEVYWNLVDKLSFTPDWFPPTSSSAAAKEHIVRHGNTLALQLVIDGMKLQPCRPTFVDAREAILLADRLLTNGAHQCEIWKGFAKRGLGVGAKFERDDKDWVVNRVQDFEIPKNICEKSSQMLRL